MITEPGILFAAGDISSVNPITLKDVIIILLALLGAGSTILNLVRKPTTSITPDPLRVEKLDKFSTRDFCESKHVEVHRRLDQHEKEIVQLREEAKEDRRNNEIHASQRSSTLHGKIESVRTELTDKIDAMPERIIELLNNLGKLK